MVEQMIRPATPTRSQTLQSPFPQDLLNRIEGQGVIAVLVIDEPRHAVPLARALLAGGIQVIELTLRTSTAFASLTAIRAEVPEMVAGIGTVLTAEQARQAAAAGASFGVAPGTNRRVIRESRRLGLPFIPGIATPSDIEAALGLGCCQFKFFPSEPLGGLAYLKSLAAPYLHLGVRFLPLGGITAENMNNYLSDPLVWAVGGSWIAPREAVQQEDWAGITARAQKAMRLVRVVRPEALP